MNNETTINISVPNSDGQKRLVGAVRQVLMNEFDLSREMIRKETESIVRTEVEKHFARLTKEGMIDRVVRTQVCMILGGRTSWGPDAQLGNTLLTKYIEAAVQAKVRTLVESQLSITLGMKPEYDEGETKPELPGGA